ncbi:ABC transporter ATP-binding protein [Arhodomonas sp. SL1]|uniref:ABC transporter ATP-binding protein n=1 Tax=Arhodomonas sp. SL1 TaxID=3425691 RepID=UPI003F883352
MSDPAVEIRALEKNYRHFRALDGVDLEVPRGERLALLGHNGAGKTTLMKVLLGLTGISAGRVRVLGTEPGSGGSVALRARIGFLPENVVFAGGMTGREVVHVFARLKGQPVTRADALLERVGLAEAAGNRVRTYSKGMRQRLGLAQALIGAPGLLLLDEPTSGLDPMLRQTFYEILAELQKEGTTILISSHVLTELEMRTDRIAIMNQGRLTACNTLDGLCREADLPIRLRVHVNGRADGVEALGYPVLERADSRIELAVEAAEKMTAIRRLTELDSEAVRDLEIFPPSLDEVYAHYGAAEGDRR